jgi:hypothetical protein
VLCGMSGVIVSYLSAPALALKPSIAWQRWLCPCLLVSVYILPRVKCRIEYGNPSGLLCVRSIVPRFVRCSMGWLQVPRCVVLFSLSERREVGRSWLRSLRSLLRRSKKRRERDWVSTSFAPVLVPRALRTPTMRRPWTCPEVKVRVINTPARVAGLGDDRSL